jgi:hypothetical protein
MDLMLLRVFQSQIELQCQAILASARQLQLALDAHNTTASWVAVQNLLSAAANASKALWGQGGKYEQEREPLRASIQVPNDSPLRSVIMRNHFDHFDERLDQWWNTSTQHNYVDRNIGPERMIQGPAEIDTFRQLDPSTGHLIFWGQKFNVPELVAEASRLLPMVQHEANKPHWETPSSA